MQSLVTHFKSQKKELIHSPCISASLTWSPVSSVNINEDSWLKCEITQWQIKCKKIKWDERFLWIKSRYVGIPPHFKSSCQLSSEFFNFEIWWRTSQGPSDIGCRPTFTYKNKVVITKSESLQYIKSRNSFRKKLASLFSSGFMLGWQGY